MPRSSYPQTLNRPVTLSGHGLHSNTPCTVTLRPVEQASGLHFVHLPTGTLIPVRADRVGEVSLATTLVQDGIRLGTIEHLLSALVGLDVDHLRIEVDGEELPILDGSAGPWVDAILKAGFRRLTGPRRVIRILHPIEVESKGKWIKVSPFPGFRMRYTIDFDHPAIGRQSRELSLEPGKYQRELAGARTFCMARDIEYMRSLGLAKGGSLENAVVFDEKGPLNETLRFEDEAVRHKMLDLVGDLALLGAPLEGLVEVHAGGHALHVELAKAILADPSAWTWAEISEKPVRPFHRLVAGLPMAHPIPA